ncbi:MAG TPA: hypothetical protein VGG45_07660 [Terracidiphilus sp.]|jgi:hypothetical protein
MKKNFLGLLASLIAVFVAVLSVCPWDVWVMPVFHPYARTSRLRRWMFGGRPQRLLIPHQK